MVCSYPAAWLPGDRRSPETCYLAQLPGAGSAWGATGGLGRLSSSSGEGWQHIQIDALI